MEWEEDEEEDGEKEAEEDKPKRRRRGERGGQYSELLSAGVMYTSQQAILRSSCDLCAVHSTHLVAHNSCSETDSTGPLASCVDSPGCHLGNMLEQLALGHTW